MGWYVDEGLEELIGEWKKIYPRSVVYTIGDTSHASRKSEHNPESNGPLPGQDKGEVDAADFMVGRGVSEEDLKDLFDGLLSSKDGRTFYFIYNRRIVSSVTEPWKVRPYNGSDPHTDHLHLSVNDKYDSNTANWNWEKPMARDIKFIPLECQLPLMREGDDDRLYPGYDEISRIQRQAGVKADGIWGPETSRALGSKTMTEELYRRLFGLNRI